MKRYKSALDHILTVTVFLLLEAAAICLLSSSSSVQDIWINRFSHRIMAFTWGSAESIRQYFSLKDRNEELAAENMQLFLELEKYRRADAAEGFVPQNFQSGEFTYIPASIVKMSGNSQHNYIILNRGSSDGIVPHSGILTAQGVAGIINAVDEHYSYGISFCNPKTSVSARLGKQGPVAPLSWDGISSCGAILKDLPLHIDVTPGDTVWTSGISTIFPGDIPLGRAEECIDGNGASGQVKVKLFQDFAKLKQVFVAVNNGRDEISRLEEEAGPENGGQGK